MIIAIAIFLLSIIFIFIAEFSYLFRSLFRILVRIRSFPTLVFSNQLVEPLIPLDIIRAENHNSAIVNTNNLGVLDSIMQPDNNNETNEIIRPIRNRKRSMSLDFQIIENSYKMEISVVDDKTEKTTVFKELKKYTKSRWINLNNSC